MLVMLKNPFTLRFAVLTVLAVGLLALSPIGGAARQADEPVIDTLEPTRDRLDEMAWVDPVITGPVSPTYKRLRHEAGCDTATWPNIPDVCFPK